MSDEVGAQDQIWTQVATDRERFVRSWSVEMWTSMLDAAGAAPGLKLLDAGCGSGELSALAVQRGCEVSGIDIAPGMIDLCVRHAPGAEFRVGDMETLPWPDASFDAVVSCNAIHFVTHPDRAIAEMRRVLRPHGRLAIVSNGPRAGYPASEIFHTLRAAAPRPEEVGNPFRLADNGDLDRLLVNGGFVVAEERPHALVFTQPSTDAAWQMMLSIATNHTLAEQIGVPESRALVAPILEKHEQPDGSVVMNNTVRVLVARPV